MWIALCVKQCYSGCFLSQFVAASGPFEFENLALFLLLSICWLSDVCQSFEIGSCFTGFNSYGFFAMVLAGMNIAAIISNSNNNNNNNNNDNQNNQNNNIQGVQEASSLSDLSSMNTASVSRRKKRAPSSSGDDINNNMSECSILSLVCKLNSALTTDQVLVLGKKLLLPRRSTDAICLYLTVAFE